MLRGRGYSCHPRLTPQFTGKAIHIVEFPWVAPPIAPHPWKAATVTIATRAGLGDRIPDKTRMCAPGPPFPAPPTIFPQGLVLHLPTLCTPSPNSAVREPPSITVVKAILKGSL